MKIIVKKEMLCNFENLTKHLPQRYVSLVSKNYYGSFVNLICFSIDKTTVISSEIMKAQKKIDNTEITTLYFARCFTIEAAKLIAESNGVAFHFIDFPWFDEGYSLMKGGSR